MKTEQPDRCLRIGSAVDLGVICVHLLRLQPITATPLPAVELEFPNPKSFVAGYLIAMRSCSDRPVSSPRAQSSSGSIVEAGHWCSRCCRAAKDFVDRRSTL